jgi:hypothetical protein
MFFLHSISAGELSILFFLVVQIVLLASLVLRVKG